MQNSGPRKTILRWAGSKRKTVPYLREFWSISYKRYIEPFMGSACLFFDVQPSSAILGDINLDLVDTFKCIKKDPVGLYNSTKSLPYGKQSYYEIRSMNVDGLTPLEKAARFIYLNRYCFNGLYRTNKQGKFNVPFSSEKTGGVPSLEVFLDSSEALQRADIRCTDFGNLMDSAEMGDFVYLDPPYAVRNQRIFSQYGPDEFGIADLDRLSHGLNGLEKRGAFFVLSYADAPETREIFSQWKVIGIQIRRNIAGFARHRRLEGELIVTNI